MRTILLGPQRFTVRVTGALRSLETEGPVALINAGWEEREDDIGELDAALDNRARNLRLFHRLADVLEKDPGFALQASRFRDRHDELTNVYRVRLQHAMGGVYAVQRLVPSHPSRARNSAAYRALADAVAGIRAIDTWYLAEVRRLYGELEVDGGVNSSDVIAWHRAEVRAAQNDCVAWILPGGNIRTLMSALRLFDVTIPHEVSVIAWSAGAMALTERIALFHDHGPEGSQETELFDAGLGRVHGVVAFPHARRRLRMDDPERLGMLALRFEPAECVLLDDGAVLDFGATGTIPLNARRVGADGLIRAGDDA
ncbi:MAG: hypothetical protein KDB28_02435 [Tetrasphaera sp.]|nr:hypothetical protein [Tetrasphaera sp.]